MPDLVCQLLPGLSAAATGNTDTAYIFRPVALKKVAHHPDGVLWPRNLPGSSEALPVVILEVQMHSDRRFHRRLAACLASSPLAVWRQTSWPVRVVAGLAVVACDNVGPAIGKLVLRGSKAFGVTGFL
jgi:hypothetical protein